MISEWLVSSVYLIASILFIQGLRYMTHPRTATKGNFVSACGMFLAVGITLLRFEVISPVLLITGLITSSVIGSILAFKVERTEMPQLVGLFNGFGGGASALVAGAELIERSVGGSLSPELTIAASFAGLIGAITLLGSLIAAGKLQGLIPRSPMKYKDENLFKALFLIIAVFFASYLVIQPEILSGYLQLEWFPSYWFLIASGGIFGILLVISIGGADMPVIISLLNSFSGLAAAGTGFVLDNTALIIAGTLVGAAGLILTNIMCKSMNRDLKNVLFGGVGEVKEDVDDIYEGNIKETSPEEVEMLLDVAQRVVIVPGYGMAVARAQNAVAELVHLLEENDVDVEFGIHPVAGRMPGHMNSLLAEADIPYDKMKELEEINTKFSQTDIVITIGANDVVNPRATTDESGPIAGMPILEVWKAKTVIVNKRSLSPGFSGISNSLFTNDNTQMLFGDAKEMMQQLVNHYKENH